MARPRRYCQRALLPTHKPLATDLRHTPEVGLFGTLGAFKPELDRAYINDRALLLAWHPP